MSASSQAKCLEGTRMHAIVSSLSTVGPLTLDDLKQFDPLTAREFETKCIVNAIDCDRATFVCEEVDDEGVV